MPQTHLHNQIAPAESSIPQISYTITPPIAIIPQIPVFPLLPPSIPRPLSLLPPMRQPNGDIAKTTNENVDSDKDGDESGPKYETSEDSKLFTEKQETKAVR